jgi:hypothetical protein
LYQPFRKDGCGRHDIEEFRARIHRHSAAAAGGINALPPPPNPEVRRRFRLYKRFLLETLFYIELETDRLHRRLEGVFILGALSLDHTKTVINAAEIIDILRERIAERPTAGISESDAADALPPPANLIPVIPPAKHRKRFKRPDPKRSRPTAAESSRTDKLGLLLHPVAEGRAAIQECRAAVKRPAADLQIGFRRFKRLLENGFSEPAGTLETRIIQHQRERTRCFRDHLRRSRNRFTAEMQAPNFECTAFVNDLSQPPEDRT